MGNRDILFNILLYKTMKGSYEQNAYWLLSPLKSKQYKWKTRKLECRKIRTDGDGLKYKLGNIRTGYKGNSRILQTLKIKRCNPLKAGVTKESI